MLKGCRKNGKHHSAQTTGQIGRKDHDRVFRIFSAREDQQACATKAAQDGHANIAQNPAPSFDVVTAPDAFVFVLETD